MINKTGYSLNPHASYGNIQIPNMLHLPIITVKLIK